jgi:hypothetical protein
MSGDNQWQPMDSAPKDGREVRLQLVFSRGVPAYWDEDLNLWVLSRPLHIESIHVPHGWAPK